MSGLFVVKLDDVILGAHGVRSLFLVSAERREFRNSLTCGPSVELRDLKGGSKNGTVTSAARERAAADRVVLKLAVSAGLESGMCRDAHS